MTSLSKPAARPADPPMPAVRPADPHMPAVRPADPRFSSGPCAKIPGYRLEMLSDAPLGRSHRAAVGKAKLARAIDLTAEILGLPGGYRVAIVPGSDTGAVEMAMWTLLGQRPCEMLAWESFGEGWVTDAMKQLRLDAVVRKAPYGGIVDFAEVDFDKDVVFTWNGTTSGVRVPNGDAIPADRRGLTICDATSAAFAMHLPWDKLDVVTFSWQKVLGGEGAHGMLILGPRAVERLESYTPAWPLPKLFRLTKGGKLVEGVFRGETINTPSMLAVEDYLVSLDWARSIGGLPALVARAEANAKAVAGLRGVRPVAREPRERPCHRLHHQRLPALQRPADRGRCRLRQGRREAAGGGGRGLRRGQLPRRAAGPAHLVRLHGGDRGRRGPDALDRLGLRGRDRGRGPRRLTRPAIHEPSFT